MKVKVESSSVFLNLSTPISLLEGSLKLNLLVQCVIYKDEMGDLEHDIDYVDDVEVEYMGQPLKYDGFRKFKDNMKEVGIDIDQMTFDKFDELTHSPELHMEIQRQKAKLKAMNW